MSINFFLPKAGDAESQLDAVTNIGANAAGGLESKVGAGLGLGV